MIECIFDPELFWDTEEARKALSQHITVLKANPNIIIGGSNPYFEALRQQIQRYSNPSIRHTLFGMLNKRESITVQLTLNDPESKIQHVERLICKLPTEERTRWIIIIQDLLVHEANRIRVEDEIVIATWWKPELVVRDQNGNIILKRLWCLHVKRRDEQVIYILNLCSERNWQRRWTARYADELPDIEDQNIGNFPFCCPLRWWILPDSEVNATRNSRQGWVDNFENVWAESAAGPHGRKHWDVQICPRLCAEYHLGRSGHLNINKWGTDKNPGEINHGDNPARGWKRQCINQSNDEQE